MLQAGAGGLLATALAVALGLASPHRSVLDRVCRTCPGGPVFVCRLHAVSRKPGSRGLPVPAATQRRPLGAPEFRSREVAIPADASVSAVSWMRWRFFWAGLLVSLSANIDLTLADLHRSRLACGCCSRAGDARAAALCARRTRPVRDQRGESTIGRRARSCRCTSIPRRTILSAQCLNTTVGGTNGFYSLEFGLRYTYDMLVGQRGVFSFTPMLIFAFIGMAVAFKQRPTARPDRDGAGRFAHLCRVSDSAHGQLRRAGVGHTLVRAARSAVVVLCT